MASYHINPETGEAGLCRAQRQCPFGDSYEHYSSRSEAQGAYEQRIAQSGLTPEVYLRNLDYAIELASICRKQNIKFPNHSSKQGGKSVSLDDCRTPLIAEGNCWTVSDIIIEEVDPQLSDIHLINDREPREAHSALFEYRDYVIIDFTFRQFDPESPWPLVVSPQEWIDRVNRFSSENYSWDVRSDDELDDDEDD